MIGKIFTTLMLILLIISVNKYKKTSVELIYNIDNNYIYKIKESYQKEMICLAFSPAIKTNVIRQGCIFTKNSQKLAHNYIKDMLSSLYFNPNPKNVLMIGLGAGTLTKTFAEILPNAHIDVVDINPYLTEIDKKYFDFDIEKYKNVSFHLMDAFEYVKNAEAMGKKYDIIIGDVFDDQYIPTQFLTNGYMRMIKNIMSDDGIFSNNSFMTSKTRALEDKLIEDNFGKKYLLYKDYEIVIFTTKDNNKFPLKLITKNDENYIRFKDIFKKYGINDERALRMLKFNEN